MNKQRMIQRVASRKIASRKIASGEVVYVIKADVSDDTTWKPAQPVHEETFYARNERELEHFIEKYYKRVAPKIREETNLPVHDFEKRDITLAKDQPSEGLVFKHALKTWSWGAVKFGQYARFHITSEIYEDKEDLEEVLKVASFLRQAFFNAPV